MDRRTFLQCLSYLAVAACKRGGPSSLQAPGPAPTNAAIDALIDQRLAERAVDFVSVLEASPHLLRRAPEAAAELRATLRDHPEVLARFERFRVSALQRLRAADIGTRAKMLMLGCQLEKISHAVTTCMDHFIGVHDILKSWKNTDEVASVGLFHAMYGTEYFIPDLLDYRDPADRQRLRVLVGETSERWILQYALMLSEHFVVAAQKAGGPPKSIDFFEPTEVISGAISPTDFVTLAELQVANAFEPYQQSGRRDYLSLVEPFAELHDYVSSGAKDAIARASLGAGAQRSVMPESVK